MGRNRGSDNINLRNKAGYLMRQTRLSFGMPGCLCFPSLFNLLAADKIWCTSPVPRQSVIPFLLIYSLSKVYFRDLVPACTYWCSWEQAASTQGSSCSFPVGRHYKNLPELVFFPLRSGAWKLDFLTCPFPTHWYGRSFDCWMPRIIKPL